MLLNTGEVRRNAIPLKAGPHVCKHRLNQGTHSGLIVLRQFLSERGGNTNRSSTQLGELVAMLGVGELNTLKLRIADGPLPMRFCHLVHGHGLVVHDREDFSVRGPIFLLHLPQCESLGTELTVELLQECILLSLESGDDRGALRLELRLLEE